MRCVRVMPPQRGVQYPKNDQVPNLNKTLGTTRKPFFFSKITMYIHHSGRNHNHRLILTPKSKRGLYFRTGWCAQPRWPIPPVGSSNRHTTNTIENMHKGVSKNGSSQLRIPSRWALSRQIQTTDTIEQTRTTGFQMWIITAIYHIVGSN